MQIKRRLSSKTVSRGFALPTVLILSIVLLAIGVSTLQVGSSLSRSLIDEHWDRLAKTASQAGVSFASSCLSTGLATWSTQLVPNTDCSGAAVSPARSIYISSDTSANASPSRWQSTYTVTIPVTGSDAVPRFRSIGKVELLSATSEIVKTYTWTYDGVLTPPATPTGGVTGAQFGGSGGEGVGMNTIEFEGEIDAMNDRVGADAARNESPAHLASPDPSDRDADFYTRREYDQSNPPSDLDVLAPGMSYLPPKDKNKDKGKEKSGK